MTTCFLDTMKLKGNIISSAINFLDILHIRQSISSVWRDIYKSLNPKTKYTDIFGDKMYNSASMNMRAIIQCAKKQRAPSCIEKWSDDYPGFHTAQKNLWSNIFRQPFSITRDTKLQTFQYKLIHL